MQPTRREALVTIAALAAVSNAQAQTTFLTQTELDWLKALVWPDQVARFANLQKALDIYARQKPEIRTGDALDLLPDAIARIPENQPVCVYHTMAIYQFSEEARDALDNFLRVASLRRPVWRLAFEGSLKGENALTLGGYRNGRREVRTLAMAHPHGTWMEWRD